jgi:hypothetical protein
VATSEDDAAKREVQDAVWAWAGRFVVVLAVFVLGLASGYWFWGYGPQGAPHLRQFATDQQARYEVLDKKRVDLDGRLTVCETRMGQCVGDLQKCRTAAAAAAPSGG